MTKNELIESMEGQSVGEVFSETLYSWSEVSKVLDTWGKIILK